MASQQTYSLDQIKDMLLGQIDQVVHHYAPPAKGSHTAFGKYFTLNPGRADRSVGSFYVHMTGAKPGYWRDHASGQFGDILDLIALSCHTDTKGALTEARAYLGLATLPPEEARRRKDAAARQKAKRDRRAAEETRQQLHRSKQALAIWLSGREQIRGTPVEHYLRDARGIDLSQLGRQPGAIRYVPNCHYYDIDQETGEVIEADLPAMVAIITNHTGRAVACHRTYLALDGSGRWGKAPVPMPKKVLGQYAGGWINIWKGRGPRGGKPAALSHCPPGTEVFVTEGIEDALSTVMLMPEARVIAAISLSNLGQIRLPGNVSGITLVADLDENDQARAQLDRAIGAHQAKGRTVRIWQNSHGGKDLNDALRQAGEDKNEKGAA